MGGPRRPSPTSCDLIADVLGADRDEVLALNGHRPRDRVDEPRVGDLIAKLQWVELTDERYRTQAAILDLWRRIDRGEEGG